MALSGSTPTHTPRERDGAAGPILVTGAAGHLGANLVRRLLADGHRVRVLLRDGSNNDGVMGLDVERVYGDLRDPLACAAAAAGCSRAYHTAAKVSTLDGAAVRREVFECNVVGTRNLLGACREAGVARVVVTGSFSAVGYHLDDPSRPADESVPVYPFHRSMPYERSKVLVEHECLKAVAEGQDVVVATSCAIIGPHDYKPSRLGGTLCAFANGRLRAYIPGGFEFVSARDIVEGHVLAMTRGRTGHRYTISTGYLSVDELMDLFEQITGTKRPRLRLSPSVMAGLSEVSTRVLTRLFPRAPQRLTPGAVRLLRMCRRADVTKARDELGFAPTSLADAVQDAYEFFVARGRITRPRQVRAPAVVAAHA
jgi:nucleoside-diphosphate-sugar epimerase